jgi:hypothetical protein
MKQSKVQASIRSAVSRNMWLGFNSPLPHCQVIGHDWRFPFPLNSMTTILVPFDGIVHFRQFRRRW